MYSLSAKIAKRVCNCSDDCTHLKLVAILIGGDLDRSCCLLTGAVSQSGASGDGDRQRTLRVGASREGEITSRHVSRHVTCHVVSRHTVTSRSVTTRDCSRPALAQTVCDYLHHTSTCNVRHVAHTQPVMYMLMYILCTSMCVGRTLSIRASTAPTTQPSSSSGRSFTNCRHRTRKTSSVSRCVCIIYINFMTS